MDRKDIPSWKDWTPNMTYNLLLTMGRKDLAYLFQSALLQDFNWPVGRPSITDWSTVPIADRIAMRHCYVRWHGLPITGMFVWKDMASVLCAEARLVSHDEAYNGILRTDAGTAHSRMMKRFIAINSILREYRITWFDEFTY